MAEAKGVGVGESRRDQIYSDVDNVIESYF